MTIVIVFVGCVLAGSLPVCVPLYFYERRQWREYAERERLAWQEHAERIRQIMSGSTTHDQRFGRVGTGDPRR